MSRRRTRGRNNSGTQRLRLRHRLLRYCFRWETHAGWRLTRRSTTTLCLCIGIAGAFLSACSETTKYHVLSFFLDGVPKPETLRGPPPEGEQPAETGALTEVRGAAAPPQRYYAHRPYREGRCGGCHSPTSGQLLRPIADGLCLNCHADVAKGRYVHGPVAVNGCDLCHLPHSAPYPKLLQRDPTATCLYCHEREDLAEVPQHKAMDRQGCTDCHDPHHGDRRYFLKRGGP